MLQGHKQNMEKKTDQTPWSDTCKLPEVNHADFWAEPEGDTIADIVIPCYCYHHGYCYHHRWLMEDLTMFWSLRPDNSQELFGIFGQNFWKYKLHMKLQNPWDSPRFKAFQTIFWLENCLETVPSCSGSASLVLKNFFNASALPRRSSGRTERTGLPIKTTRFKSRKRPGSLFEVWDPTQKKWVEKPS